LSMIDGQLYILAVLEKSSQKSQLKFTGDLSVETQGSLSLNSARALQLSSSTSLSHISPEIKALSKIHTLTTDQLTANSQKMTVYSEQVQAHIKEVHGMFERVYQKADQVIRWVETIETLNIGNWVHNIKGTLNSRANNQIITAKSDVKVDAERIHMG
jgi:hypothetical protein